MTGDGEIRSNRATEASVCRRLSAIRQLTDFGAGLEMPEVIQNYAAGAKRARGDNLRSKPSPNFHQSTALQAFCVRIAGPERGEV
jgi:hypothetical protein